MRACHPAHERHQYDGRGKRLRLAFDALDTFPALIESRERLRSAIAAKHAARTQAITAIEADIALTCGVLRLANAGKRRGAHIDTVRAAVEALDAAAIDAFAREVRTFDYFEHASSWGWVPVRMRLHALATQDAAARIADELRHEHRERLAVACLLHDIGKLVLARAYPGYPTEIHRGASTPQERAQLERRELGVDHAMIASVQIERWGLPTALADAIEQHHVPGATGEAAIVQLADLLAHYEHGARVSPGEALESARAVGLAPEQLRAVMYRRSSPWSPRRCAAGDCPLTERELSMLRQLAEGSVYKQIAHDLSLSASTIRTHLHNIYCKLGVVNRAQAVLVATERGWI